MVEQLKALWARVLEWWNKYTARQKTVIIGIAAGAVFMLVLLIYVFTRPKYVLLQQCETTADTAKVQKILTDAGITDYQTSADGLKISIKEQDKSVANVALGAAGYTPSDYNPSDYLNNSMSATASDKERLWSSGLEKKLEKDLTSFTNVKSAKVNIHTPPQNGTLLAKQQESTAFIKLETEGIFTSAQATAVARAVQSFLGNETTAGITILDQDANLLFAGGDDYSASGIANSMLELKNQAESMIASQVTRVLYGTNQYNTIEVTSHLDMDYAEYQETVKEYYANADRDEGMIAQDTTFESENSSDVGGVPGATSNDGTVMVSPDNSESSSTQSERDVHYLPNESLKTSVSPAGAIHYDKSSVSISMIRFKELHEEDAKKQGLLDGVTWEEYKAANSEDVKQEVDPDFYAMVATATGIPQENVTIVAYVSPVLYDKEPTKINWTNVMSAILLLVILGLLAFVVMRSMRVQKDVVEEEEEISVESLLQSTPEAELEDIDVEAKSETRKVIEKFVDDNPEAAAALLRNWLNDDWG